MALRSDNVYMVAVAASYDINLFESCTKPAWLEGVVDAMDKEKKSGKIADVESKSGDGVGVEGGVAANQGGDA